MKQLTQTECLDALFIPTASNEARKRYHSLAQRAAEDDFGPLEDGVVVLDTETTGLSFRNCALIEIAAARIEGKEVVERFQTYVNPGRVIPPEIQKLTGIRAIDVAQAPSAPEAVAQLAEFAGGAPILAHNASFDRTFIEMVPGGREVSESWIDTLSLSRIALPLLSSHRLGDMAKAFGCDSVTHRAMDDVNALVGMWPIMLEGLCDLPAGLLRLFADLHPEVDWPLRPLFSYLSTRASEQTFSLVSVRDKLVEAQSWKTHRDAAECAPLKAPSREAIERAFSGDGLLSRLYDRYERRDEQCAMALEVRDGLATSTHRTIEAGTGVGKSMAYLVPAVIFAQENGITVGVATKTNALTDQLVSHELPALDAALPGGVSFVSLKGYDHYPCLSRLQRAVTGELPRSADGTDDSPDVLTAIAVTYAAVCQSAEGDLDTLGIRWRNVPRSLLTTTPSECQRWHCPFYPKHCLVHGARRRASCADVVVTNHSLLLRNVDAEGRILPPIRHWIVDEAHGLEAEARRQWAVEVTGEEVRNGFEKLGGTETGAIHAAFVQLKGQEGATLPARLLTKLASSVSRVKVATSDLFDALHELNGASRSQGGYDTQQLWIDEGIRQSPQWAALSEVMLRAEDRLEQVAKDGAEAVEALDAVQPDTAADLRDALTFVSSLHDDIGLIRLGEDLSYVYSARLSRHRRNIMSEALVAEKVDVGAALATRWLPEMMSVTFTSATMAVGTSFEHFNHAVGLDQLGPGTHHDLQLSSSFDFDRNMSVIVCKNLPAPGMRGYLDALEDLLFDIHRSMDGSVLTLFTNRREMEQVYASLKPRLAEIGLEVDCQAWGMSPRRLRERFVGDRRRSLMALKSFWEGIDAAGDTLRCVVIPKLPFANPNDPLVRERDLREDRSWWRYSLPEAVLEVKQAAGRLIRTSTDAGIVVLADSRVEGKRYGRNFVDSMPSHNHVTLDVRNVGTFIETWRNNHDR